MGNICLDFSLHKRTCHRNIANLSGHLVSFCLVILADWTWSSNHLLLFYSLLAMYDTNNKLSMCIMKELDFVSYSVLSVSPNRLVAALGNINGKLRLLSWNGKFLGDIY